MSQRSILRVAVLGAGLLLALGLMLQPTSSVQAQSGGYAIAWYSIDGGGLTAAIPASGYSVSGTIGQADTGTHTAASYALYDGFWPGIDPRYRGFTPIVQR